MKMTIDVTKLGKKEGIQVPQSQKNVVAALRMQKEFMKVEEIQRSIEDNEKSATESIDATINLITKMSDFIKLVLNLNKKDSEKVDELDLPDLQSMATDLVLKMQGLKRSDLEESNEDQEEETNTEKK